VRKLIVSLLVGILVMCLPAMATEFKIGGVYTAWAQSQQAFTLKEDVYDNNYVVQMLRFNVQGIASDNLKFVTRFDIAQGWWGVDNALKSKIRTGTGGGSALFDFKDTNFLLHVDQAYVDMTLPNMPVNLKIGRQWYGVGNKLMVDNNYEGVKLGYKGLSLGWAKVSEGGDGTTDNVVYDTTDPDLVIADNRDADLYVANYKGKAGALGYDAFGFYYKDQSIEDGDAYIVDHLQFFRNKDAATVTQLMAAGLAANYKAGKISVKGEFDFLTGKDEIHDLDLSGYNVYANLNYTQNDKLSLGAVLGMGSGDDANETGFTNVNKLRTSGFFYITEIWEDSIMPDEEGITPQGLGAPNVKAYRELENTTIAQVNATFKLMKSTSVFLSGSYIMASNDIKADDGTLSSDLGTEVDFRIQHNVYKNAFFMLRGGYFIPGDAAGYLINGHNVDMVPAYELKGMVTYKF